MIFWMFSDDESLWVRVVFAVMLFGSVCGLTGTVLGVIDRVKNADAYLFDRWQKKERKRLARTR